MPISGIVIRIDADKRVDVTAQIEAIPELELAETPPGELLVAVMETATLADEEALFKQVADLPGVSNVTMSYHNFEDIVSVDH